MAKQGALTSKKANGRVYTPAYIVENILDLCGYKNGNVPGKHIMDNSCGDGAFLVEAVRRYCEASLNINVPLGQIGSELSEFIHGIETDKGECEKCIKNLTAVAEKFGVSDVDWDIRAADTLTVKDYNGKMDYVVGNPPYVRVHNLSDSYDAVKGFSFAQNGMTDLFIVFYEIGLNMLNSGGVLGFISPSSLFNSLAGAAMREHLIRNRNIKAVVDLKHFQPFKAATYTTVLILSKQRQNRVDYCEYDEINLKPLRVSSLRYEDFQMNGSFIFGDKTTLRELKKITSYVSDTSVCEVKNGFATLCDNFFIGDFDFEDYTIPIVKASTGKNRKCLFPYDNGGKLIPFERLTRNPAIREHYEAHAAELKNRSFDASGAWYGFGRSQGINDVRKKKYAVNALIRDVGDIKFSVCGEGTGVYGGLYILSGADAEELKSVLFTEEFIAYVAALGKYKSGGYYTYSSKDLQRYINYKFAERAGYLYEQLSIS